MGPVDIPRARPSLKDAAQRRQAIWPTLSVIPRGKIGGKEERPQPSVVCIATTIVVANKSARMASAMMAGGSAPGNLSHSLARTRSSRRLFTNRRRRPTYA
jgi:hypothetical protein